MDIDALFSNLHTLPSIPKVAQDLIQQFDSPTSSLDGVARNIALDPVIAAKVLRLANSARFRGARESTSIEDAAMRLGFKNAKRFQRSFVELNIQLFFYFTQQGLFICFAGFAFATGNEKFIFSK